MDETERMEEVKVRFSVGDLPIELQLPVPAEPVKLRRMLPVLQRISSSFVRMGEDAIREQGKEVSCRAGCGACCRQLVPVSEAEAYHLSDLVAGMPEPRRSEIANRFRAGMDALTAAGYFQKLGAAAAAGDAEYEAAVDDYFRLGIACPFLEDESCSIHEDRPITCREYLVTSPPELCSTPEGAGVENVKHLFQFKESLISISRNRTEANLPYVPLIGLLEWTEANPDDSPERPGREWAAEFFRKLAELSGG